MSETDPAPPQTLAEIDAAISTAARLYIAAVLAHPRDPQLIADRKAAVDDLVALREQLYPDA